MEESNLLILSTSLDEMFVMLKDKNNKIYKVFMEANVWILLPGLKTCAKSGKLFASGTRRIHTSLTWFGSEPLPKKKGTVQANVKN